MQQIYNKKKPKNTQLSHFLLLSAVPIANFTDLIIKSNKSKPFSSFNFYFELNEFMNVTGFSLFKKLFQTVTTYLSVMLGCNRGKNNETFNQVPNLNITLNLT